MISTVTSILSLVAFGAAQSSSTVSLFLPFADRQSLVGSIAGSDATATTYVIGCPQPMAATTAAAQTAVETGLEDGSDDECGFAPAFTIAQGPSTVHYVLAGDDRTASVNCQLMGSTQAVCAASATGPAALTDTEPSMATETLSASDITYLPVVITAGSATAKQTGSKTASPSATAKTMASTATSDSPSTQMTGSTGTGPSTTSSGSAQGTNAAMGRAAAHGAGVLGALGVAVAGVML